MENNQKPLVVIVDELREAIFSAVNNSKLSPTITGMVIKEIYEDIKSQCESFNHQERTTWKKSQITSNKSVTNPEMTTKPVETKED